MKILSVVGARPQFIKLAPLSRVIREAHEEVVVHTGQHYDFQMSEVFFRNLDIPEPNYNLDIGSGTHAEQTAYMMIELEKVIISERPNLVLLYGDTNSTVAASLTVAKLRIPSAHIEAGLRNMDKHYPEEINRIISDHLSILNFAPTKTAMEHLKTEGLERTAILTGDVMVDVLQQNLEKARAMDLAKKKFGLGRKEYNLLTIHRPDNADDPKRLRKILSTINNSDHKTIFPAHPRTVKTIKEMGWLDHGHENIILSDPVGYLEFISLLDGARNIITDSGGIQKEAYCLGTPCITLLKNTPWIETVEDGWNVLVQPDDGYFESVLSQFRPTGERKDHYGNGQTSEKILVAINAWWEG